MIDKNKQYRTRDGREVRIYATDGGGNTVHGAVLYEGTYWRQHCWGLCGQYDPYRDSHLDLIEVKPRIKREVWVNVYRHDDGYEFATYHDNAIDAEDEIGWYKAAREFARVRLTIDCEEGEGL